MDVLAECACDAGRRELQEVADRLFAALGGWVPDESCAPDADPFELLIMPRPYVGNPQPLPTDAGAQPAVPLPPRPQRVEWTSDDDVHVLSLFRKHGTKWRLIAREAPLKRSDDAVRNRVQRLQRLRRLQTPPDPPRPQTPESAKTSAQWRVPWTEEEDRRLLALVRMSHAWPAIARSFDGRTAHACRNRVFRLSGSFG